MTRNKLLQVLSVLGLVSVGCSDSTQPVAQGSGGTTVGSGGSTGSGGGIGGAPGSGGVPGSGGGTAGATGSGGSDGPFVITSAEGAYWKTDGALTASTSSTADVTVDDATSFQTWEGFGGCFNEMGWDYLSKLSATDKERALQLLFGNDGTRFVIGRIPIGASDYAMTRYTLNETAGDTAMANFSIARDEEKLIPFIKAAQAIKSDLRFWASPWTPPTWMKSEPYTTPANVPSAFDGGTMKDDAATLGALAQYFVKFVQAYNGKGINIEAVAPQNEPNYLQNYPSCSWATATYPKFIGQYLGPAFTAASLSTKIMLGTMSNADKDPAIMDAVMADATAKPYVKIIGMQWGMVNKFSYATKHNLPIWNTEHRCGNFPWESSTYKPTAPNDFAYAVTSWTDIRQWIVNGATAYNAWNMVLDTVGKGIDTTRDWAQNSLLTIDTTAKTLNLTPTYYVFRHLSQYVAPGAKRVKTTGGDPLAFKNPDGSVVLVIYNSASAKNMTVAVAGKKLQFAMPKGWATIVAK